MASVGPNLPQKFPNEINPVLLCMGLFLPFLFGRHP